MHLLTAPVHGGELGWLIMQGQQGVIQDFEMGGNRAREVYRRLGGPRGMHAPLTQKMCVKLVHGAWVLELCLLCYDKF